MKLKSKLAFFNIVSKLAFTALFLLFLPYLIERLNLRQVDNELIQKRERVINLIAEIGIEPFITSDTSNAFGSYNILKDEFISLERLETGDEINYIEVTPRIMDGEEILYRVLKYSFIVDNEYYLLEVGESNESIIFTQNNTRKVLLVFLLFFILITYLTDFQYTRSVLKPLDLITRKLKHISDPSQFDRKFVKTSTDDFLSLDKALVSLMDDINALFLREREITVNISHELLTPVSVLRSKLENLLLEESGNPGVQIKIEQCLKTLQRMQSLINSLLMIARIEGHQYIRGDEVSIREVLKEIIEEIKPLADDRKIRLEFELVQDFRMGMANRPLIFAMLSNILINALKNTPSSGIITIMDEAVNGQYSLIISDTGKGLSEEQMEKLFMRFKARDGQSGEGTGIGLAIAKTIADFHHISITVASEIKRGTKISFHFPQNS